MKIEKRINSFSSLGEILGNFPENTTNYPLLEKAVSMAKKHNAWFTHENILSSFSSLSFMLKREKLNTWISKYPQIEKDKKKNVGVIMAGNIPLAGFHDFLCVLISGNIFYGKLSSDDVFLLPAISEILCLLEPEFKNRFFFTDAGQITKKKEINAWIATGSNNSARHFEYYFRNSPHIIRKNRTSVAVVEGNESDSELKEIGKDVFSYFGLGCRNVSKIFFPENFNTDRFFSAIVDFSDVIHHNKYFNNYSYYRSIYLLNKEPFLDNNFLLLKEDLRMFSPVATLYFERYKNRELLFKKLEIEKGNLQCISGKNSLSQSLETIRVGIGQTQSPELWNYADGIDSLQFLLEKI